MDYIDGSRATPRGRASRTKDLVVALNVGLADACPATMRDACSYVEEHFPFLKVRFDVPPGTFAKLRTSKTKREWLVWRGFDVVGDRDLLLLAQEDTGFRAYTESGATDALKAMVNYMRLLEPGVQAELQHVAGLSRDAGLQ